MKDNQSTVLDDLAAILNKIKANKVYGSVEVYFEDGEITQITQRIINKVKKINVKTQSSLTHRTTQKAGLRNQVSTLE